MIIGAMNKRIELLKPVTADDEYGGQTSEYVSVQPIWAELAKTNYSEQQALGTPMNRSQLQFKIRPRLDIKRGWRIIFEDNEYKVDVVDKTYNDRTILIVSDLEAGV